MQNGRLKIFFSQKRGCIGTIVFSILLLSSIFANFISNDKPLFLILKTNLTSPQSNNNSSVQEKNDYRFYFPVFVHYSPQDFGQEDAFVVDYQNLIKENKHVFFYILPVNHWNPEQQLDNVLASPSSEHWLGTDNLGRDILARLIYGIRTSLYFGLSVWVISFFIGVFIGAAQGYLLGWVDFTLERFKELSAIIPTLTLVILVTAITNQQSFFMILFMVLLFAWMGIASQIRASVLSISQREFCEAARALGASHSRIIIKHILANSLAPIITLSPFAIEGGISLLAALDYLGFGLPPPTPSLGELLAQGRDHIQDAPWVLISPIIVILLLLISINLIGQSLRDAFDPKTIT
jgi:microcin C transport system permease protein